MPGTGVQAFAMILVSFHAPQAGLSRPVTKPNPLWPGAGLRRAECLELNNKNCRKGIPESVVSRVFEQNRKAVAILPNRP